MLDKFVLIELFLIVGLTSVFAFVGMIIKKEKDVMQKIMIAMSVFLTATILGNTISPHNFSVLWLLSYLVYGLIMVIINEEKLTPTGILVTGVIAMMVTLLIPFDSIQFPEEGFLTLNIILLAVNFIIYVLLYRKLKSDKFNSNVISILALGLVTSFLGYEVYHLALMIIYLTILLWHCVTRITEENNLYVEELQERLQKLDKEFQYEVRKEVNKHTFHLKEVQEKMSHINKIDNLTKAYNKKAIFDMIEGLTDDRRIESFSIIMFDLDNFKTLNDTLGHVQGDICLKSLSNLAKECIRESDSLGRYGGDEFLIVLPKASLSTAITIGERFRALVDKKTQPHFTVSIGLATYPDDGNTLKELLDIADKGLYLSKEKGRNAVSYHNPDLDKKY